MLTRSLITLQNADIGFRPAGALTARVSVSGSAYDDERTIAFFEDLVSGVRALPGVSVAGAARWLPVIDAGGQWDIRIEGRNDPPGQPPLAVPQEVTPGFFPAMGMPLLAGRDFTDRDRIGALPVAIVNRALTRLYLAGEDPLGRRFRLGGKDSAWVTIVGVVSDMQARGPGDVPEPSMYFPLAQLPASGYYVPRSFAIVARTGGDPSSLANAIRDIVRGMDASVPVSSVRTLDAVVATATANRRFSTQLIVAFAVIAAVLAGVGIYGVMSYAVAERTYEIGLRVALGAEVSAVLRLILGLSARLAGLGLALGLIGAMALGRVIRALLVDASAIDVPVLLGVAASLAGIAMVAALLPAWRAAKIPPTEALRSG
jgi:predicted permease